MRASSPAPPKIVPPSGSVADGAFAVASYCAMHDGVLLGAVRELSRTHPWGRSRPFTAAPTTAMGKSQSPSPSAPSAAAAVAAARCKRDMAERAGGRPPLLAFDAVSQNPSS